MYLSLICFSNINASCSEVMMSLACSNSEIVPLIRFTLSQLDSIYSSSNETSLSTLPFDLKLGMCCILYILYMVVYIQYKNNEFNHVLIMILYENIINFCINKLFCL